MNIILSILIAIISIFALKRYNTAQEEGLGDKRFLVAIALAIFPYLDRVFTLFGQSYQLAYENNFLWSLLLLPIYSLGFTAIIKVFFFKNVNVKFLYPSIAGTLGVVYLFSVLGNDGVALFSPISDYKFTLHLLHSFDFIIFLIGLVAVVLLYTFKNYRRDIARASLFAIFVYVCIVASFSYKARLIADDYIEKLNIDATNVYTLAQPLSSFNWRVMIFTKDHKIHDSFITLKSKQEKFEHKSRTKRVADLYRPADKAVWRIYRQVNPNYQGQYDAIMKYFGDNSILKNTLKFSILKDSIDYKQYRCLRFKDLRTEGIRKSLKGNILFCQNPKTNDIKILSGTKDSYEPIDIKL